MRNCLKRLVILLFIDIVFLGVHFQCTSLENVRRTKNCQQQNTQTSRDFKQWFASGPSLPTILARINGNITQAHADQWLTDLSSAAKAFPSFCNSGDDAKDRQEFAAFLTIVGAETSFLTTIGFPCTKEIACTCDEDKVVCPEKCESCNYNSQKGAKQCKADPKIQYFGRGPLQLSWDFNYINFSQYYFNNTSILENPNILATDQKICWASALWFWMTPQSYGGWCMPQAEWSSRDQCSNDCPEGPTGCKNSNCTINNWLNTGNMSPHDAIHIGKGMGQVINIINGGYDCCPSTTYFSQYGHTLHRVQWFAEILQLWGQPLPFSNLSTVPIKECPAAQNKIDCSKMKDDTCSWNCCNAKSD